MSNILPKETPRKPQLHPGISKHLGAIINPLQ